MVTYGLNPKPQTEFLSKILGFSPTVDQFQEDVARTMKEEAALYPFCTETMILGCCYRV